MKGKHCIFLLLILAALISCNDPKPVTETLHRAEALMNEYPDSAWTLLNTISSDDMEQKRNRALYALLYTQAQDKTYRDETNDSLISVAVDYYRDTDDVRHKFLSYYYKGRVHFNTKDYLGATTCYMEAEQLADEVGDDYLVGLLYAELGRIYNIYYDYPKSLEAHRKAAECYERAGKIRHRNYMWRYQSAVYRNMDKFNESERLLQKCLASAKEEGDEGLIKSCVGDLLMLYVEQNRMIEARLFCEEYPVLKQGEFGNSSFMGILARLCVSEQNYSDARCYLEKGWERVLDRSDSINLYLSSAILSDKLGDGKKAYQELLTGISMQNVNVRHSLEQPILTMQRDYLSDRLEFQNYKLRMEKHLRVLYIVVFSLLLIIVVWWLVRKLKMTREKARITIDELNEEMQRKEAESHHKIASLLQELEGKHQSDIIINSLREELSRRDENLKQYICESESIRCDLQHVANENLANASQLFREKMQTMSEMVLKFEEKKDSNIIEEIRWWKNKYLVGRKAIAEMERQVNLYNEDVMLHFRKEVTMSEEKDYHWVCYLFAGVSVKAIAWLLGENKGAIYQRRFRLRSEIEASDYLHKELFLELLDK